MGRRMRFVHLWFGETSDNAAKNVHTFGLGWGVGATSAPPPTHGRKANVLTRTIEFSAQAKAQSPWPAVAMAMSKEPGPNVAFSTPHNTCSGDRQTPRVPRVSAPPLTMAIPLRTPAGDGGKLQTQPTPIPNH
jgi:hypothetical protein